MDEELLVGLLRVFVPLSFLSIGGGGTILAEMAHQTVDVYHWLTRREFVDLFAITRAAPGPGILIVTLIGWKVAGWLGALVATLALFVPSSLLFCAVTVLWQRFSGSPWRKTIERGLAPIAVGLIFAGAYAVLEATQGGLLAFATAGISAALLLWRPIHPLVLLCAAAGIYGIVLPQI
jgi:chromate transporter